ncbi:hypothetical protein BHM03_00059262 [Ensete ventricosum]|nr:hypothetical protein BHM03_00059262 [Ensete ventricosum]
MPETARSHHQPPSPSPPSRTPLLFGADHPPHRRYTNKGVIADTLPQERHHSHSLPRRPITRSPGEILLSAVAAQHITAVGTNPLPTPYTGF